MFSLALAVEYGSKGSLSGYFMKTDIDFAGFHNSFRLSLCIASFCHATC